MYATMQSDVCHTDFRLAYTFEVSVTTVAILHRMCKKCFWELTQTFSQFLQTFLTNPSKLRIYLFKIPTVIAD